MKATLSFDACRRFKLYKHEGLNPMARPYVDVQLFNPSVPEATPFGFLLVVDKDADYTVLPAEIAPALGYCVAEGRTWGQWGCSTTGQWRRSASC